MLTKIKNILKSDKFRIIFLIVLLMLVLYMLIGRNITFDYTAERTGKGFTWRGENYVYCNAFYKYDRRVAKTTDGFDILTVKGDKEHNFLILSSFLDNELCVREGYEIKNSGDLTAVYWKFRKTSDSKLCDIVEKILESSPDTQISIENIWQTTNNHEFEEIGLYYEDSPVGLQNHYLGYLNGNMVLARFAYCEIDGEDYVQFYDIFKIEEADSMILKKYIQEK